MLLEIDGVEHGLQAKLKGTLGGIASTERHTRPLPPEWSLHWCSPTDRLTTGRRSGRDRSLAQHQPDRSPGTSRLRHAQARGHPGHTTHQVVYAEQAWPAPADVWTRPRAAVHLYA